MALARPDRFRQTGPRRSNAEIYADCLRHCVDGRQALFNPEPHSNLPAAFDCGFFQNGRFKKLDSLAGQFGADELEDCSRNQATLFMSDTQSMKDFSVTLDGGVPKVSASMGWTSSSKEAAFLACGSEELKIVCARQPRLVEEALLSRVQQIYNANKKGQYIMASDIVAVTDTIRTCSWEAGVASTLSTHVTATSCFGAATGPSASIQCSITHEHNTQFANAQGIGQPVEDKLTASAGPFQSRLFKNKGKGPEMATDTTSSTFVPLSRHPGWEIRYGPPGPPAPDRPEFDTVVAVGFVKCLWQKRKWRQLKVRIGALAGSKENERHGTSTPTRGQEPSSTHLGDAAPGDSNVSAPDERPTDDTDIAGCSLADAESGDELENVPREHRNPGERGIWLDAIMSRVLKRHPEIDVVTANSNLWRQFQGLEGKVNISFVLDMWKTVTGDQAASIVSIRGTEHQAEDETIQTEDILTGQADNPKTVPDGEKLEVLSPQKAQQATSSRRPSFFMMSFPCSTLADSGSGTTHSFRSTTTTPAATGPTRPPNGFLILPPPPNPTLDIVFVHGIDGHQTETWTNKSGMLWPQALLSSSMPTARILLYGYDARSHGDSRLSLASVDRQASTLRSDLCSYRRDCPRRPIIFVCHCTGGILVKQALIDAFLLGNGYLDAHRTIYLATVGLLFFGTPHQGFENFALASSMDQRGNFWQSVFPKTSQATDAVIDEHDLDSRQLSWLDAQANKFRRIQGEFITRAFAESLPTQVGKRKVHIVPPHSAVIPGQPNVAIVSLNANHWDLVKFGSKNDEGYIAMHGLLEDIAKTARQKVDAKWAKDQRAESWRSCA